MKENLQDLMEQLGEAVHHSLDESTTIAAVLKDFQKAGYTVVLSVDATLSSVPQETEEEGSGVAVKADGGNGSFNLTEQDEVFLRALNIEV